MGRLHVVLFVLSFSLSQILSQEIYSIEDFYGPSTRPPKKNVCLYRELENGYTIPQLDEYDSSASVQYGCQEGFELNGMTNSGCVDGSWISQLPECLEKQAPPKKPCKYRDLENGVIKPNQKLYAHMSIAEYSCVGHYTLQGSPIAACFDGEWNVKMPTCADSKVFPEPPKEYFCKPPVLPRGSYSPSGKKQYAVGSTVSFKCKNKYYMRGLNVAKCKANGKWDKKPSCEVGCQEPKFDAGFYKTKGVNAGNYFGVGQTVTYHCSSGYRLLGAKSAKCKSNGRWSKPVPKCEEWVIIIEEVPGCKAPHFPNGFYLPVLQQGQARYEVGETLTFECYNPYTIKGSKVFSTCQANGKWSAIPQCRVEGCLSQNIQHGYLTPGGASYGANSVISLSCDVGYYAIGQSTAQCMPNGQWNAQLRCADGCIAPQILHMQISPAPAFGGNVYEMGHRIRFQCDLGYSSGSVREAECKGGDKWDKILPQCRLLTASTGCPMPELSEGLVLKNPVQAIFPYKAQLEFSCMKGFSMIGSAVSICRKGHGLKGGLDPLPPKCNRAKCGSPGTPQNGRFRDGKQESYLYGDTVYFVCDPENVMSGIDHITCQADGQFNGQPPTCQPPSCKYECIFVKERNCQCDALCRIRGDCCYDFEQHCRKLFY